MSLTFSRVQKLTTNGMSDYSLDNKRIAKNTILLFFRMFIVLAITLYTSRVVLNALGVEDYGVYNVIAGFVSMFSFLNASFSSTIQRFYNYSLGKGEVRGVSEVYSVSLIVMIILAVVLIVASEVLGLWFIENKLVVDPQRLTAARWLLQASICSLFFLFIQMPFSSAIMAKEKMDYYAFVGIIEVLLKLSIAIIVSHFSHDKLILYSWLLVIVAFVNFLFYFIYAKNKFPDLRFSLVKEIKVYLNIFQFSGWSALSGVSQIVKNQGLNMVLNVFFGPVVNAARGIAFQVKSAMLSFVSNIITASRPQIVESYVAGNIERTKRLMFTISKISYVMLLVIALPLSLNIDYVLTLWLGTNVPDYTGVFTIWVIVTTLVDNLNSPIQTVVYAEGKIAWYSIITSTLSILVYPTAYCALRIGCTPISVFKISFLFSILIQIVCMICLQRTAKGFSAMDYFIKVMIPICIVTILSSVCILGITYIFADGFVRLFISILSSIIIVCIITYWLGLNYKERQLCKSILRGAYQRVVRHK